MNKTNGLSQSEARSYDSFGRLSTITDPRGYISRWQYDSIGRVASVSFGATSANPNTFTSQIAYSYDSASRLVQALDSNGPSIIRAYDALDRIVSETLPTGTVRYSYDTDGRVISIIPSGSPNIIITYSSTGSPLTISQNGNTVQIAYDAVGRRASLSLPGGVTTNYSYDISGRLNALSFSRNANSLGTLTYSYDADNRIISVGGSLASVLLPAPMTSTNFDASNALVSNNNQMLSYDSAGNLIRVGQRAYVWDARNRLASIADSNVVTATFSYLPDGRRLSKSMNGNTTKFLYNGPTILQEQNASSAVVANNFTGTGIDELFTRSTNSGTQTYLQDIVGSVIASVNPNGSVGAQFTYAPYGLASVSGNKNGGTQSFTGREDDGTGLLFFRARYLDPNLGRFIQRDPLGVLGGTNPYLYAASNPVGRADPFGLFVVTLGGALSSIVGAGGQYSSGFYWDSQNPFDPGAYETQGQGIGADVSASVSAGFYQNMAAMCGKGRQSSASASMLGVSLSGAEGGPPTGVGLSFGVAATPVSVTATSTTTTAAPASATILGAFSSAVNSIYNIYGLQR